MTDQEKVALIEQYKTLWSPPLFAIGLWCGIIFEGILMMLAHGGAW